MMAADLLEPPTLSRGGTVLVASVQQEREDVRPTLPRRATPIDLAVDERVEPPARAHQLIERRERAAQHLQHVVARIER